MVWFIFASVEYRLRASRAAEVQVHGHSAPLREAQLQNVYIGSGQVKGQDLFDVLFMSENSSL